MDENDPEQRKKLLDYAKQINLLRFDVVELEQQLQSIKKDIEKTEIEEKAQAKKNPDEDDNTEVRQQLYNLDETEQFALSKSQSIAAYQDKEVLNIGADQDGGFQDPKAILEHFELRTQQQRFEGKNHDMPMHYQRILPEKFEELEREACKAAVNQLLGKEV